MVTDVLPEMHELVVVGAGPAGISAAATAESEAIDTIVLDSSGQIGGQAGTSSFIENYMGFPQGISGDELMAKMVDQALRFDTAFLGPVRVENLIASEEGITAETDDSEKFLGHFVLLSMGVEYRVLKARNLAAYLGRGATYGSPNQKNEYEDKKIMVIGGANSAGQAAFHLSRSDTCKVHLLVRGDTIEEKMSSYLVDKVKGRPNLEIHTKTELVGVEGNGQLEQATIKQDGRLETVSVDEIFVLIGSSPKTSWLPKEIETDEKGFVIAGSDLSQEIREEFIEKTGGRSPLPHETSMPRVFVAGDVRCGTNKRVALAVGDGAAVVPELHRLRNYPNGQ